MNYSTARGTRYNVADLAEAFATAAHGAIGQTRKYTGEMYINHPRRVAETVASVTDDKAMIAAAWLHDVVEDTKVSLGTIRDMFGSDVANLVGHLTDVSTPLDGNRAARKEIDFLHTSRASSRAQTIKLADLIDNTWSITRHDPEFAKVYLVEKERLLKVLVYGNSTLWERAHQQVLDGKAALGI